MAARVFMLIPLLLLCQCGKQETEKTDEVSPPTSDSTESAGLPDSPEPKDTSKSAPNTSDTAQEPKRVSPPSEETVVAFSPDTEIAIGSFFEAHPDLDTINKLVAAEPFRKLKDTHLPNWQPDAVMKERIIESLRMAAAAQGVDPTVVASGDPQKNPKISINIAPDPEGLRRVMGYLYEGDGLNYGAELLRQLDNAVMQSMAEPDSAQIQIQAK